MEPRQRTGTLSTPPASHCTITGVRGPTKSHHTGVLCGSFFFCHCILNILHIGNYSCASWVQWCVQSPFPRMRHCSSDSAPASRTSARVVELGVGRPALHMETLQGPPEVWSHPPLLILTPPNLSRVGSAFLTGSECICVHADQDIRGLAPPATPLLPPSHSLCLRPTAVHRLVSVQPQPCSYGGGGGRSHQAPPTALSPHYHMQGRVASPGRCGHKAGQWTDLPEGPRGVLPGQRPGGPGRWSWADGDSGSLRGGAGVSGAASAQFKQLTLHPRGAASLCCRHQGAPDRLSHITLRFHGKLVGSKRGFRSQADLGPAGLSGAGGAPFATGHQVCEWGGQGPLLTPLQYPPGPGLPWSSFWKRVPEVPLRDFEGIIGPPARVPGRGGPPYPHTVATLPGGWGDHTSPGSVRQCANLTFGFMTLFLCSKCHGKCQAEAEAGKGPVEEVGGVLRGSGQGGALGPSPPPRSPLGLPVVCLGLPPCPRSVPASHCDLVEMLPLFTCCQGPDGAGSGTCQQSPLQVWAASASACAAPACCVTLGSTRSSWSPEASFVICCC